MICQHCNDDTLTYKKTEFEAEAKQGDNPRKPKHLIVTVFENYECPTCGSQLQTKTQIIYELQKQEEKSTHE